MGNVIVRTNVGSFDELDGRYLVNGERIRVLWPDGSETDETVRLDVTSRSSTWNDMTIHVPVHQAYIDVAGAGFRGFTVTVRLGGSELDVERVEAPR